ncbi:TonB-linked outer membrane protein, SusC/RagA family [Chitinophaga terrae (ex Kim and Jung 2007)]|uniref:TonB-linked outer membrane protein, SusC/RagA family n=2 Tax=Chitinophaga terrae (ex Kim and Jung 2007) TaxID=408074 RepID=A0A1H3ZF15_9BACT|nr:TonB-linked outer membrane protein, SusC/RagA family [Chitinophaga terrae (ex Kim and Jung 2007)]
MKLSFFIVFLSCMQVAATGYSQRRISLDLKNTKIKRVLDRIAGQSTVHFLYSNRKVDLQQKIDVQAHGEALDVVLNKVLDGTGFTWKELDNELVVIIPANTAWDNIKVKGRIVSADENEPLPGVTVQVKGTSIGTLTDADGKFSIDAPAGGQLVFRYVGYEVMELPVKANMDVQLKKSSSALTEVVVIGYGVTQKKDLTGSVVSVTPKEFNKGIISNPVQVLQGKVAGLVISKPGGNPNGKVSISLRGASSLSASSQPLFVVDGIPGIDINAVPPDDIVSIDVLKDASAAAIYGSRGANGVIMVTTRRGKDGAPQVSYSGYIGIDRISNTYDVLSADQYRQYLKDNNLDARAWDLGSSTDWQKAVIRTGLSHSHNISMSGGKDNTRYSASVNYLNNEGVVLNSGLERIIGRITLDQGMFNNRLRLGLSMNYVGEKNRYAGQDQDGNGDNRIWEQMIAYNPTAPVYNADGTFYEKLDINDNYNPVALANQIKHQRAMNKFIGSAKATYDITKHLTYDLLLGLERASSDRGLYYSKESPVIEGAGSNGTATRASRTWDNKTLETYFTYNQQWQKNTLKVTAGYSYQNFFTNSMSAGNTQFVSDIFSYNNLGAGQGDQPAVSSGAEENSLVSFIGRAFYSYQDKYLLTATVRRDGSTRFGKDRKWGTFPSASLAWRLTQEPFLQNSSWLQDLKLRVGYGVTGNQEISNYKSPLTYAPGGKVLDNGRWVTSYQIGQNENPNLRWESAAQFNAGFDFVMFKGRLNGTIEYYDKRTKDLLFNYNVPSPPYLFPSMLANVGKISNKGVEESKVVLPTKDQIIAQMKVLRAFHYYLAIDAFGNIPIVTSFAQTDPPRNTPRAEAFKFVEKEILDNIQALPATLDTKNYGKVTKGMAFMLLARLYANAQVYTGTARWADCIKMCDSVTRQGYQLEADYFANFSTHNENSKENIFVVPYDAINAKGMMLHYLTLHYNNRYTYGLPSSPWNGWCTLQAFYESFEDDDKRKTMFLEGQQYSQDGTPLKTEQGDPLIFTRTIGDLANAKQTEGVRIVKYEIQKNTPYADQDNDLVIFRYADALMLKAECLLRMGREGEALAIVNNVRARNFESAKPLPALTLDILLAERGKEFIWEGCRRQDLIRFGKWNSAWQFHPADGEYRKLFPIPQAQLDANPNLVQNPGYK